jgi:dipeptidyl aminopeptidase/acylaminoacyl peptidase
MVDVERVLLELPAADFRAVEVFTATPKTSRRTGALLFVHGNQGGQRIGGREMVDNGAIAQLASALNITAASISQPGYGTSDGPPDFCGPVTQDAIRACLEFLRSRPTVDPARLMLYGVSRGAIASAVVATKEPNLRALVLASGIYDLEAAYRVTLPGIRQTLESEAGTTRSAFEARSAMRHAKNIRAETLILHGLNDDRAPPNQAQELAEALDAAGARVSLKLFDCGHNIPRPLRNEALRSLYARVFS